MRSTPGNDPKKPARAKRPSRAAAAAKTRSAPGAPPAVAGGGSEPTLAPAPLADAVAHAVSDAVAAAAAHPVDPAQQDKAVEARPSTKHHAPEASTNWTKQVCRLTQDEYMLLTALKKRSGRNGGKLKRGEVLRLGLAALAELSDAEFRALSQRTSLTLKR